MQQDSMILRHLPRKRMKADLSKTVLTTLDLRGIKLPPPPLMPLPGARRRTRRWPMLVGALLFLVAIGVGSYFFFAATAPPPRKAAPSTSAPAKTAPTTPDKSR
jgi:hypothetical protein